MNKINLANVEIDIHDGPIGVMLSGGADSSILFYILMKYAPGPIHVLSCANGSTNNREPYNALNIVNECMKRTKRNDVFFHSYWVSHKTKENLFPWNLISLFRKDYVGKVIYAGFTRPPPVEEIKNFDINGPAIGGIYDGEIKENYQINGIFYLPFVNETKKKIAEIYKLLDVESLYSITRSCESLTLTTGHCGTCWWCKERIWAFGKLE